jgi:uncharacterized membrane protein YkvA (DUF1232 family)
MNNRREKDSNIRQSAINNLQAGENITFGNVIQNSQNIKHSGIPYNHTRTIIDKYKEKKAQLTQDYKTDKQRNHEYLCNELKDYCEELIRRIEHFKYKDLEDLKNDVNKLEDAIRRLEQLLRPDADELKIIHILEDKLLKNLWGDTEERVRAIKKDYEARQEKLEENLEQEIKKCEQERDIGIYSYELIHKLSENGYPLKRQDKIYLERISSDFSFNESIIENIEREIIEPFYEENLQKYEQAYQQKLDQEGFPLSHESINELKELEHSLGLPKFYFKNLDVKIAKKKLIEPFYQDNLHKYKQTYEQMLAKKGFPLSSSNIKNLKNFKEFLRLEDSYFELLGLKDIFLPEVDSKNIEKSAKRPFYHNNIRQYEKAFREKTATKEVNVSSDTWSDLKDIQQTLGILDEDSRIIEALTRKNFGIEHFISKYCELREFLADGEWQKADEKTRNIILTTADQKRVDKLDDKSIKEFPDSDIYTIDRLWVEYSRGQFGLSVQKKIFDSVNQKRQKFGEEVGWSDKAGLLRGMFAWRLYSKLDFTLSAPREHLPVWGAVDQKIFEDNFLHLKVWDFGEGDSRTESSTTTTGYQEHYSEETFWKKITKFSRSAGKDVIEKVLTLFYTAKQPNIPLGVKAAILGALGYFILPIDLISDFIPIAGWTDDLGALGAALASAIPYITPEVKAQVKKKMGEIFGK